VRGKFPVIHLSPNSFLTYSSYALFKVKDKKLLKKDDLATEVESAEGISNM